MNVWKTATVLAAGFAMGCMSAGPPLTAQDTTAPAPAASGSRSGPPLLIDRTDLRIGTTVHFDRLPTATDINDLRQVRSLAHVVLDLVEWPDDVTRVSALAQVPEESDVIVVLRGYPPSRPIAELWDYAGQRVRVIMLVPGPPTTPFTIDVVNSMRRLERVIAEMDEPSRWGFELLQRPLSFRKVIVG